MTTQTRLTPFYRVSDCLNSAGGKTSVCMKHARLSQLLQFGYEDKPTVNKAIRAASAHLFELFRGEATSFPESWSQRVTDHAFAKLTGAFNPAKATALDAERLQAEHDAAANNQAWEEVL